MNALTRIVRGRADAGQLIEGPDMVIPFRGYTELVLSRRGRYAREIRASSSDGRSDKKEVLGKGEKDQEMPASVSSIHTTRIVAG